MNNYVLANPTRTVNSERYPETPGAKVVGTSKDAAEKIAPHAKTVRRDVLKEYATASDDGLTPDEAAKLVGNSVLTVRPRCAELKRLGHIKSTGETRKNASGHSANVLRITVAGMREVQP